MVERMAASLLENAAVGMIKKIFKKVEYVATCSPNFHYGPEDG